MEGRIKKRGAEEGRNKGQLRSEGWCQKIYITKKYICTTGTTRLGQKKKKKKSREEGDLG